jgi:hypothetical protein
VWAKDRSHLFWRKPAEVVKYVRNDLGNSSLATKTIEHVVRSETKQAQFSTQPDLVDELTEAVEIGKKGDAEPRTGRPPLLAEKTLQKVIDQVTSLVGTPGFGVGTVQAVVSRALSQQLPNLPPQPVPSESWCRWVLTRRCRLSYRLVTSKILSSQAKDRQDELFDILSRQLAYFIAKHNVKPVAIIMSDEFGQVRICIHGCFSWHSLVEFLSISSRKKREPGLPPTLAMLKELQTTNGISYFFLFLFAFLLQFSDNIREILSIARRVNSYSLVWYLVAKRKEVSLHRRLWRSMLILFRRPFLQIIGKYQNCVTLCVLILTFDA